jgi:undecaprenyl-diphosphatase
VRLVRTGVPGGDLAVARAARLVDDALLLSLRPHSRLGHELAVVGSLVSRRGVAWYAASAGLVAAGGRHRRAGGRHRRAGVDGAVAWQLATFGVGAIKRVVARRRPHLPGAAGPATRSSSMPSSHTASAVAYAVAAGLADPVTAPFAGAFAALVAWSRLAAVRHFPSDVAVGVVLGAGVGVAVHVLPFPRPADRPHRGHDPAPGADTSDTGSPTATGPGATVVA